MPFEIVRNDITNMRVEAIVNSANPRPVFGAGTDAAIHQKAGPELLEARKKIGNLAPGSAAVTPAFRLQARFVIHTVGPVWNGGGYGEESLLRSCYENSLRLALEQGCQSIAFPLIATNNYGFPRELALQIAISVFSDFLLAHEMQIYLVVFDRQSFRLSEMLFRDVASYIDENYVDAWEMAQYGPEGNTRRRQQMRRQRDFELCESAALYEDACESAAPIENRPAPKAPAKAGKAAPPAPPMATFKALSLEEMLKQADAGFTQTLLKLIDERGKKDSEVYKKANLTKQHFSKIRNNPDYRPTKPTAIALALALELDLEGTRDLIGRAGYALTNSSKFDLIIRYFIENRVYDVVKINCVLFEHDQNLLGA